MRLSGLSLKKKKPEKLLWGVKRVEDLNAAAP
jgi:hypothetical protein